MLLHAAAADVAEPNVSVVGRGNAGGLGFAVDAFAADLASDMPVAAADTVAAAAAAAAGASAEACADLLLPLLIDCAVAVSQSLRRHGLARLVVSLAVCIHGTGNQHQVIIRQGQQDIQFERGRETTPPNNLSSGYVAATWPRFRYELLQLQHSPQE